LVWLHKEIHLQVLAVGTTFEAMHLLLSVLRERIRSSSLQHRHDTVDSAGAPVADVKVAAHAPRSEKEMGSLIRYDSTALQYGANLESI
jgi:hypothetical protein